VVYFVHRVILVESSAHPLGLFSAKVAAAGFEPAQFSLASDFEPFGCCFMRLHLGHDVILLSVTNGSWTQYFSIPALPVLLLPSAPTFTTFRLAKSNAPFLTFRHKETMLFYITQHAFALHHLAKALEQLLLRLT
jgi:hypothetical protein